MHDSLLQPKDPIQRGLILLFTGTGKGKTTAALGTLLRAWGHDFSCGVIQFIKSADRLTGERLTAERLGIDFLSLGEGFTWCAEEDTHSAEAALKAWQKAQDWILSDRYNLILLDEITYLFSNEWLDVNEAIRWFAENKPPRLHLLLTGRYAPRSLIDFADLVTEMKEVKHPYQTERLPAQIGIEF